MRFEFEGIHFFLFGFEFVLYYYGLVIMGGTLAGGWLAAQRAARRGYNPELVWDLLIWLVIGAIIGARLWHVFTPSASLVAQGIDTWYYLTHPFDLINLRKGGLGLPGGVLGGAIALYLFTRRHGLRFAEWADLAAPSLALGQAIGRWGNFFNQELYGAPTDLPWKLYIDPQHRLPGFADVAYYHPLFLYESLWNVGNMLFLLWLARRFADKLQPGDVFLAYLVVYPFGRFLLEFLRLDASQVAGINVNQMLMLVVMLAAIATLAWRHKPTPSVMRSV